MSTDLTRQRQMRESAVDRLAGMTMEEERTMGDLEAALKQIFSKDNMTLKADLKEYQVGAVAKALSFAGKYQIPELVNRVQLFLQCSVSKNRMGRFEYVDAAKSRGGLVQEEAVPEPSVVSRLLGR